MTRDEKIAAIVNAVNATTDVPIIGEVAEGRAIDWLAQRTLAHLPDLALDAMLTVSDGLDDNEIEMLTDVLTSFINKEVDVPWVPENVEEIAIRQAVSFLLEKSRIGLSVLTA